MSARLERLTVTMPSGMAAVIKHAVEEGGYASSSEVVREALRDWSTKRQLMLDDLAALKKDINKGLADVAAGRVRQFDADSIIKRGRRLLAARSSWPTVPNVLRVRKPLRSFRPFEARVL